jgi:hypothetical protein
MSKAKAQAIKKPKNEKLWKFLKLFGLSLFSNDSCVEGRDQPWYIAVGIALMSIFCALCPIGSANWGVNGGQIIESPTYNIESGLMDFQETLANNGTSIVIDTVSHTATISDPDNKTFSNTKNKAYYHLFKRTTTYLPSTTDSSSSVSYGDPVTKEETYCDLAVFNYTAYSGDDFANQIFGSTSLGITGLLQGSDILGNTTYAVNSIVFGKDCFFIAVNPSGTSGSTSTKMKYMNYNGSTAKFDLANFVKENSHGEAYSVSYATKTSATLDSYKSSSLSAWKLFLTDAYAYKKTVAGWQSVGVWGGVFAGVIVFMGLMVFIMTRGKENPFRIYSFWQCQKIAYWAALSPAILALILGYIWSSYVSLYFIFLYGLRVMWMSMKSLRPYQQQ